MMLYRSMICLVVMLLAFRARAADPATAPADDALQARLRVIDQKTSAVKDLTAHFVQEKQSPLLKKPIVSRGTIAAKGARSLWETVAPQASSMSCDPNGLKLYFPSRNTVEVYPMRSQLGVLAATPLPSLDAIRKNFAIAADNGRGLALNDGPMQTLAIRLTPSAPEISRYVDHIRVLLDADRGLVLAFELTDPDGEVTVLRFSNIRIDANLADSAVEMKAPAGVKTIQPLGDAGMPRP